MRWTSLHTNETLSSYLIICLLLEGGLNFVCKQEKSEIYISWLCSLTHAFVSYTRSSLDVSSTLSSRGRPRSASPKRTKAASPMAVLFPSPVCYTWRGEKHNPTGPVGQSTSRESLTEKKPSGSSTVSKHDGRDLQKMSSTSAQARKVTLLHVGSYRTSRSNTSGC